MAVPINILAQHFWLPDEPPQEDVRRAALVDDALLDDEHRRDATIANLVHRLGKVGEAAGDLGLVELVAEIIHQRLEEGAGRRIHRRLVEQRAAGTATLLISEDLDEIRNLSDRIAVMYEGQIVGVVDQDEATTEQLGLMMAGASVAAS